MIGFIQNDNIILKIITAFLSFADEQSDNLPT